MVHASVLCIRSSLRHGGMRTWYGRSFCIEHSEPHQKGHMASSACIDWVIWSHGIEKVGELLQLKLRNDRLQRIVELFATYFLPDPQCFKRFFHS